jgi:two-component system, OmpR family, response regulator
MRGDFYMLVADRDETCCDAIATLVSQIGLAVTSVSTGAEALDLARRDPPSVVAIDVELADPSGYEVCREMRDRYGETLPIVFMSSVRAPNSALTKREPDVLGLLVDGRRLPEIAETLCITRKTAGTHMEHILAKLGAHSQAQAVAFAMRDKVLPVRV